MAKDYNKILKKVLKEITPSKEESKKLKILAKKTLSLAGKGARKYKAKVILAGSATRDTWLPGKKEFDVFVIFPEKLSVKKLEELGLKIGKDVISKLNGRYTIEYAQHPYVSGLVDDTDIDIVPCYGVKSAEKLKSAVDRTPFHVKYIDKKLLKKAKGDVRLFKQFCRANGIYGADTKTEGFSGYVCELLIIKYKKFVNLLKAVIDWKPGEIVDIEKVYSGKDIPKLKKMFWNQILILIDPTDKNRNTAAAVSVKNFFKLKKIAREFLQKPTIDFFFERKLQSLIEEELILNQIKRRTELILVKFNTPKVVPDILWPQLRKFADRLQSILEEVKYEFKVLGKDVYTDEKELALVLLEMEVSKLPRVQKRIGPSVFDSEDSKRFLDKYREQALTGPFVEDLFWTVEVRRKFLSAREKLEDSLRKSAEILKAKGIPNNIADELENGFEIILENERMIQLMKQDSNFGVFLRKYFEKERLV
jgi:tRNA nucleotidyltransferase (CCA-adding enzyme)